MSILQYGPYKVQQTQCLVDYYGSYQTYTNLNLNLNLLAATGQIIESISNLNYQVSDETQSDC
jgi:hypothetical protein